MSTEWLLNALANRVGIDKGACVKHSNVTFAILSGVKENLAYVVGILVLRWFTKSHNLFFVQELKKQPGFALQNDESRFETRGLRTKKVRAEVPDVHGDDPNGDAHFH